MKQGRQVRDMKLEDKIALCSGASLWETKELKVYGIPSMFMSDGPHGLRKQEIDKVADNFGIHASLPATCFPAEALTACSWDQVLLENIGMAIGREARTMGVGMVLGPGCNIKRNPLCGRNFEYFSEDPYLAGKLAAGFIRGVESLGVATSLKHFALNSQEKGRFTSDGIIDERTLREIYLTAFEIAIRDARPATVMCAYPKINGIHCSDNKALLTDILREEWGFDGLVVTDWGAIHDRIEGFRAGCDLCMPGGNGYMEREALEAVRSGKLPEEYVDTSVGRILSLVSRTHRNESPEKECDMEAHHELARRAARESAVLLKNDGGILPLRPGAKIAVIGHMARTIRYQGSGSSHINPWKLSCPLDYLPGAEYAQGCDEEGNTSEEMLLDAIEKARNAETAVVFAGLPDVFESEGFDRTHMTMTEGHVRMIEAVAEVNENTVVVLMCGCVVECPWADRVRGILYMGLPGQAGGEAVADLLTGRENPSGKLAESWPLRYSDVPSSEIYGKTVDALYQEGIYVGYRYYEKAGTDVRWPFGYGLSYTEFAYDHLCIEGERVSIDVTNRGDRPGAEVVQMYIAAPRMGLHRPVRELKGFQKVFLQPGESRRVVFDTDARTFAIWQDGWKIPSGVYRVQIGGLEVELERDGQRIEAPEWQAGSWYEDCIGKPVSKQWEKMLGRSYRPAPLRRGSFTMDHTLEEMKQYSLILRLVHAVVVNVVASRLGCKKDYSNPQFRMMIGASAGGPLRNLQISGGVKAGVTEGLLEIANGRRLKGILRMLRR
ncbi:MAG: glycoside hydrolase family 3 C-terminal domain-containing protein [Christensenellales bacterium]|nr:glycoside hydrolase family 3 C-terminal domain-containing protein [Christensenellales bacterium]